MDLWSEICICMFFCYCDPLFDVVDLQTAARLLNGIGTWAPACVTPSLPHCDWLEAQFQSKMATCTSWQSWQPMFWVWARSIPSQQPLYNKRQSKRLSALSLSTRSICCAFGVRRPSPDMIQFGWEKSTCGMQLRTSCCALCASPTLTKLRKPGLLGSIPWSSLLTSYCSCQHQQQTSSGVSQLVHPQHHSAQTSPRASPSSPVARKDKSVDWQSLTRYSNVTKKTPAQVNGPWRSWNAASAAAQEDFYIFVLLVASNCRWHVTGWCLALSWKDYPFFALESLLSLRSLAWGLTAPRVAGWSNWNPIRWKADWGRAATQRGSDFRQHVSGWWRVLFELLGQASCK